MEAKKCDCCGAYYQVSELRTLAEQTAAQMNKYRCYERTKPLIGIALQYENNTQQVIDLCPSCMQKIIDVIGGE